MTSKRTDLVFDVYISSFAVGIDMKDRASEEIFEAFSIVAKQKIEGNIKELLSNSSFKNELLNFPQTKYYQNPFYAGKIVFLLYQQQLCEILL